MAKNLRELYEESLSGKFTRVYDVFGSGPSQDTVVLAGQTHIPAPVEGDGPFVDFGTDAVSLLRGGINAPIAAGLDELRIGKFLVSANGVLSLIKQSTLQLQNPNTSYKTVEGNIQPTDNQLFDYTGVLASVAGTAFGLHFDRHGLIPSTETDPYNTPGGYLSLNKTGNNFTSRLALYNKNKDFIESTTGNITLNSYWGGTNPLSKDFGKTTITTVKNSFGLNDAVTNKIDNNTPSNLGFKPWSYDIIQSYGTSDTKNKLIQDRTSNLSVYPRDFREFNDVLGGDNYIVKNVHKRIGVTSNTSNIGSPNTVDSINVLTITPRSTFYYNSNSAKNAGIQDISQIYTGLFDKKQTQEKISGNYARDIIKFRIEFLNNDTPVWPLTSANGGIPTPNTDVLAFRAYLDSLTDNFTSNWKEFNYMGRGESFYTYENFKRDINFSFLLYAHSAEEMPAIYTKLNYLMSNMAPDYTNSGQMRGNYAYLTIGDYIYQQPGVFTSLNVSELLTAPWEIALNEPELRTTNLGDAYQHEVPKYMKISMAFKPIHNFLPKKNKRDKEHTATFITPNFRQGFPNRYLPQESLKVATDVNGESTKTIDTRIGINARPPYPNPTSTNPLDLA
jgi:hypothetical protein